MGKPHTIGEKLIKPVIKEIAAELNENANKLINSIPLINNTIMHRIDEMSDNIENKSCDYLKENKFSMKIDESTLRNYESFLLCYVRFISNGEMKIGVLFSKLIKDLLFMKK